MKSEEMKRKKFEMLVRDIDEYLGATGVPYWRREGEGAVISPVEFFIERNEENHWLATIFNNTFIKRFRIKFEDCEILQGINEKNIIQLVACIRKCNECVCDWGGHNHAHCNIAYHLLFWLIFAMSVDDENYNNNLSVVSDVAFVLDFNEDMMKDWITAVKGVLSGKKLSELNYKTEAGKGFFVR